MVQSRFSPAQRQIVEIFYVQNELLWRKYAETKFVNPNIPEVYRFHGTPFKNIDSICEHGFLTSKDIAGRGSSLIFCLNFLSFCIGTTIWSATSPATSVHYAQRGPNFDGTHCMFLAKVLSGMPETVYTTVKSGYMMYPEFLITFK